jgi:hypothetical protein
MSEPSVKSDLLGRVERSWEELDQLVGALSDDQLSRPGPDGWAIKDHLAHLAAWELSLVGLLEGRDRVAAMGLPSADYHDVDQLNAEVLALHRRLGAAEARALLDDANDRVRAALGRLSDEDLQRPYAHYQAHENEAQGKQPVIGWVVGNTYEHVEEHRQIIAGLVP